MTSKLPEEEVTARRYVEAIVADGGAKKLMEAYCIHNQSCQYVYGILQHVAYEADSGISDEIVNFARNLLDDWSK
jgi:hypothetical protein